MILICVFIVHWLFLFSRLLCFLFEFLHIWDSGIDGVHRYVVHRFLLTRFQVPAHWFESLGRFLGNRSNLPSFLRESWPLIVGYLGFKDMNENRYRTCSSFSFRVRLNVYLFSFSYSILDIPSCPIKCCQIVTHKFRRD